MLNLKELVKYNIQSVRISNLDYNLSSDVSVFFYNLSNAENNELYECLRFRIIQIDNEDYNKQIYNSLKFKEGMKYFKNSTSMGKLSEFSDQLLKYKYYDISFLEIIQRNFSEFSDENVCCMNFNFQLNNKSSDLIYYTSIYIDTFLLNQKLMLTNNFAKDEIVVNFETFIKKNKCVNSKLINFQKIEQLISNEDFYYIENNKIQFDNVLTLFTKSKNGIGSNILFLIDLYQLYKNNSKYNFLLENVNFNNLIFDYIKNVENIKVLIFKKNKKNDVTQIDDDIIFIKNNFYKNNRQLSLFNFYDSNNDNSCNEYEIKIFFEDILVKFLENLLKDIDVKLNDLQYLVSTANKTNYYNFDLNIFNPVFYKEIYQKNSQILIQIVNLLIYINKFFNITQIDPVYILNTINEKTLSYDVLLTLQKVFLSIYNNIYSKYDLNKTYNQIEYTFTKSIDTDNKEIYYEVIPSNNEKELREISSQDLLNLTNNGVLKYFVSKNLENINTISYHSINSLVYNNRRLTIDSPISKTNTEEFNNFILYLLYYIIFGIQTSLDKKEQIITLLNNENINFNYLIEEEQYDLLNGLSVVYKKQTKKELINDNDSYNILLKLFIENFFKKYKNLFNVWLVNKKRINNEVPYQISALFNSFIQSNVVYDIFDKINFIEKFVFVYLYKLIYKIEYYDFNSLTWKLLENSYFSSSDSSLLCRFKLFLSDEFNIPYIKEFNFDLNNEYFIINTEKTQDNQINQESYIDLFFNKNIIDVVRNINQPIIDNDKINIINNILINNDRLKNKLGKFEAPTTEALKQNTQQRKVLIDYIQNNLNNKVETSNLLSINNLKSKIQNTVSEVISKDEIKTTKARNKLQVSMNTDRLIIPRK